jgi:hypothetical protein
MSAHLFENAPPLNSDAIYQKHEAWRDNRTVTSDFHVVGLVEPTLEEVVIATRAEKYEYMLHDDTFPLKKDVAKAEVRVTDLVQEDIKRCDLKGELEVVTRVGNYTRHDREPPHSDNSSIPYVRWTYAFGKRGPTVGYIGQCSMRDIAGPRNCVKPTVKIGLNERLQPVVPPRHSLTRFMGSADFHGGSEEYGGGFFVRATLYLRPLRRLY